MSQSVAQYMASRPNLPPHPRTLKHLTFLPPVLLTRILTYLPPHSIATLARVNCYLRDRAIPLLYRHVNLHPDPGVDAVTDKLISNTPRRSFLDVIYRRGDLAALIRELIVHDHYIFITSFAHMLDSMMGYLKNLEKLVIKACFATTPLGTVDPRLGSLLQGSIWRVFSRWVRSPFLSKLKSCEISLSLDTPWLFTEYEALLTLPSLKRLTIHNAAIPDFNAATATSARSTPLQSLTLLCCDISPIALAKMLTLPRALQHLSITGPRQIGLVQYTSSQQIVYLQALAPQRTSLRSFEWTISRFRTRDPLALNFSHLSALEKLTITPLLLRARGYPLNLTPLVASPFPASLRELKILHIWPGTVLEIERMFMIAIARLRAAGHVQSLERVVFDTPDADWFRERYALPIIPMSVLQQAGKGLGIRSDGEDIAADYLTEDQAEGETQSGPAWPGSSIQIQRTRCQLGRSFAADDLNECACCDYNLGHKIIGDQNGNEILNVTIGPGDADVAAWLRTIT
ncbi:hypothetical protein BDW74DRAFT_106310 [Aspergillus multicolor]|uniref:F-box protein n=1 Tax=Aspergillus multicolor TaxID=41759 RepID=UPI003CCCC3B7